MTVDFVVRRDRLSERKVVPADPAVLEPGQVELSVDLFGFTANNVTYGALGERLAYWRFFPAAEDGWGRIPVWGFGTVVATAHEGIAPGDRFYGFYPMSSRVVLVPGRVSPIGFVDGAPHRRELASGYNQYLRTSADPSYRADSEAEQVLLRPLFITSFLLDDLIIERELFGARVVLVSSASSKTSYGMAHLLAERRRAGALIELVGLTSPGNAAFVRNLGVYDRVTTYDEIGALPPEPTVYVDMAGDQKVRAAVHGHLGEALRASLAIGATHWEELGGARDLPGPALTKFFAPDRIRARSKEWGPALFQERLAKAWDAFLVPVRGGWMRVVRGSGADAVDSVYADALAGRIRPDEGHVLSL